MMQNKNIPSTKIARQKSAHTQNAAIDSQHFYYDIKS